MPRPDGNRQRVLFADEHSVFLYDRAAKKTKTILQTPELSFLWPDWLDEDHILVMCKSESDTGHLLVASVVDDSSRELCDNVCNDMPFTLSADRTLVAAVFGSGEEAADMQVGVVDIPTGDRKLMTEEPNGAGFGTLSPDGKRLAYMSPPELESDAGSPVVIYVVDLETKEKTTAWSNAPKKTEE